MRKTLISIFLCGIIGINLSGCGFIDGFKQGFEKGFNSATGKSAQTESSKSTKTYGKHFKDPDGKFQISVPENWSELDEVKNSNPKFSIGVGNLVDETYSGTFSESKDNFTKDMSLDKYNDLIIKSLKQQIKNCTVSDIEDSEINGYKAKIFLIKGEVKNIKASYVYAVIELPDSFVHVVTWTLTSRFDKNKDKLRNVINSFEKL